MASNRTYGRPYTDCIKSGACGWIGPDYHGMNTYAVSNYIHQELLLVAPLGFEWSKYLYVPLVMVSGIYCYKTLTNRRLFLGL